MSRSSGFASSSSVTVRGSSAMPQIGHAPGAGRTISGCIGHTHSVRVAGAASATGSRAMPHIGQAAGPADEPPDAWGTCGRGAARPRQGAGA